MSNFILNKSVIRVNLLMSSVVGDRDMFFCCDSTISHLSHLVTAFLFEKEKAAQQPWQAVAQRLSSIYIQ